jgi:hypothetical protein
LDLKVIQAELVEQAALVVQEAQAVLAAQEPEERQIGRLFLEAEQLMDLTARHS